MVVTATWCNTNVLNLFWISIGASKPPFSLLPLTPLQGGNRPRAPTTQTRHPGHALVQWGSCGDHLVAGVNTSLHLPNLHAKVVPVPFRLVACLRLSGLVLSPGKASIYSPSFTDPAVLATATRRLRRTISLLSDPSLSFEQQASAILTGHGSSVSDGHPVLGAPIGSPAYVRTFVEGYEARALSLLSRLRSLLIPTAGRVCHRDEFDMLRPSKVCDLHAR